MTAARPALGGGASVLFHHRLGANNTQVLIGALDQLRRWAEGDGCLAARQRSWLVVERARLCARTRAVEALWSNVKEVELANFVADTLAEVAAAAECGIQRSRHWLADSFPAAPQPVPLVSKTR